MRRTVNTTAARAHLGQILDAVRYRGDQYIIERSGKPMAAVVPVEQYEQWRKERDAFFSLVDEVRFGNAAVQPEEFRRDVSVAERTARLARRRRRP